MLIDGLWRIGPRWSAVLVAAGLGAVTGFVAGWILTGSPWDAASYFALGGAGGTAVHAYRCRREVAEWRAVGPIRSGADPRLGCAVGAAALWWFVRALPARLARIGDRAWAAERYGRRLAAREQYL